MENEQISLNLMNLISDVQVDTCCGTARGVSTEECLEQHPLFVSQPYLLHDSPYTQFVKDAELSARWGEEPRPRLLLPREPARLRGGWGAGASGGRDRYALVRGNERVMCDV